MPFKPLVVLTKNRVCHICQLGSRLDDRVIGALVIYIGLGHELTVQLAGGELRTGRVIAIGPYRRHRIAAGRQYVCTLLVEPESVTDDILHALIEEMNTLPQGLGAFEDLFDVIADFARDPQGLADNLGRTSFDRLVFRRDLEERPMDPRIDTIAAMLEEGIDHAVASDDCGRRVALSASRFRRLFRESTGVQFRYFRMWKRARTYLHHVNTTASLTQTALDLGYPDSTHFSHSIRQTYGLSPRDMKSHMRRSVFLAAGELAAAGPVKGPRA